MKYKEVLFRGLSNLDCFFEILDGYIAVKVIGIWVC